MEKKSGEIRRNPEKSRGIRGNPRDQWKSGEILRNPENSGESEKIDTLLAKTIFSSPAQAMRTSVSALRMHKSNENNSLLW